MRLPFPYTEWQELCGFQDTFFECPPDHTVTRRAYGWTRAHSKRGVPHAFARADCRWLAIG